MGPVTHTAQVPMDIGAHREMATFQVANLGHHEVILGMPWLNKHSPAIGWQEKKITFNNEFCGAECLHSSPVVFPVPEAEALEENLKTRWSILRAKKDFKIKVKKLVREARIPTRGSNRAAG